MSHCFVCRGWQPAFPFLPVFGFNYDKLTVDEVQALDLLYYFQQMKTNDIMVMSYDQAKLLVYLGKDLCEPHTVCILCFVFSYASFTFIYFGVKMSTANIKKQRKLDG